MIDHPQLGEVEERRLPQLLGDAQVPDAAHGRGAVDAHQLGEVPARPDAFRHRHAERRAPQQVGDELDAVAGLGVEERAASLEHLLLDDELIALGRDAVLRHAVGPGHAQQIGGVDLAEAEVHDAAVGLAELVGVAGADLDRGARAEVVDLVVAQR